MKHFLIFALLVLNLSAQGVSEEEMDSLFLEGKENETLSVPESSSKWDFFGYFESENFFSISRQLGGKNPAESDIVKIETRARINSKYGTDFFYGKASADIYFYPVYYAAVNPQNSGEIDAYELYIAAGEKLQFKIGKQVFNWGSADAFRVVNYADQRDLREMFLKEEDERYRGVFALDFKYIFSDFSIETFFIPVPAKPLLPAEKSFWALQPENESEMPVKMDMSESEKLLLKNGAFAVRSGGTFGFLDIYLSYFHGQNNSIVFYPQITIDMATQAPASVIIKPDFSKVNKAGVDLAFSIEKLALRAEAVYTHDQTAVYKDENETTVINTDMTANEMTLEKNREKTQYFSYTTGADYNIWGSNGRLLIEYASSFYIKNSNKYEEEFFSNFLLISLEDRFFNEYLELKAMSILRLANDVAYIPGLTITYNFQNGLKLTGGLMLIYGYQDDMLSMFDNHDIAYFRARMDF
ncbi:MAG: hypothetical protein OEZ22_05805 [Spirochaetia bacterium]|nr:hypothetical protein [Spirochaetia bacterium]